MRFAGCDGDSSARVRLYSLGSESSATAICEASREMGTYSPVLDRDLAEVGVFDGGDADSTTLTTVRPSDRLALLTDRGEHCREFLAGLLEPHPDLRLFALGSGLEHALGCGQILGSGRVYAMASRHYSKEQRDECRSTQRLLPLFEVDLEVALRTALSEAEEAPVFVSLYLDVLDAATVPGVRSLMPGGMTLGALKSALRAIPGERVVGFEIVGEVERTEPIGLAALTAAELLRDNILTWWHANGRAKD